MKLIGLISWYAESPAWLAATVAGLHKQGVDHVVCCDGAYFLYPDAKPRSPTIEATAILEVCNALGMGCTIHEPLAPWEGNEVEKRAFMFKLGLAVAEPNADWFLVMDADSVITTPDPDLKAKLEATDLDAGEITMYMHINQDTPEARAVHIPSVHQQPIRSLFRALPGLTVKDTHYTYVAGDKTLWSNDGSQVPALDCSEVRMLHRNKDRSVSRNAARVGYYERRDALGIETVPCARCSNVAPLVQVPHDPAPLDDCNVEAASILVCKACEPKAWARLRYECGQRGIDFASIWPDHA